MSDAEEVELSDGEAAERHRLFRRASAEVDAEEIEEIEEGFAVRFVIEGVAITLSKSCTASFDERVLQETCRDEVASPLRLAHARVEGLREIERLERQVDFAQVDHAVGADVLGKTSQGGI